MSIAINDQFPAPFEGLDYGSAFDIVVEASRLTRGHRELITEQLLWDIRNGVRQCPECEGYLGDFAGDVAEHYPHCSQGLEL